MRGGRPELEVLRDVEDPDLVLLSIGGNDAGFAEFGASCASRGEADCRRSAGFWLARLDRTVYPALVETYRRVRETAGDAPVFAMTYPNPIGPRNCRDIELSNPELDFIRNVFVGRLNESRQIRGRRLAGARDRP